MTFLRLCVSKESSFLRALRSSGVFSSEASLQTMSFHAKNSASSGVRAFFSFKNLILILLPSGA